jgi:hypothetical protein
MTTAPTIGTKVAAAYTRITAGNSVEPLLATDEDAQLVIGCVDNAEVPLHIRVKAVELIGRRLAPTTADPATVKKVLQSLVKVICDDNTPQLLIAVIHALQQLSCYKATAEGVAPSPSDSKIQENITRIAVDVIIQVTLDAENFGNPIRAAATAALAEIAQGSFKALTTKLLHLLSDDREADDVAQVAAERKFALDSISQLVTTPKYKTFWTEELQKSLLSFATLVFRTITAQELEQLAKVICELPHVKESHGAHLLEAFLLKATFDTPRSLESLLLIAGSLPRTLLFAQLGEKLVELKLVAKAAESSGEVAVGLSKALVVASRMATPEVAEKLLPDVLEGLEKLMQSAGPANFTQLEAFLLSTTILGAKRGALLLTKLSSPQFAEKLVAVKTSLAGILPELTFAIKKRVENATAGSQEAEALVCLKSIVAMVTTLAERHLPSATLLLSWEKKNPLPPLKRAREEPTEAGPAAPAPAAKTFQPQIYRPKGKQQQQQQQQPQQQQQQKKPGRR